MHSLCRLLCLDVLQIQVKMLEFLMIIKDMSLKYTLFRQGLFLYDSVSGIVHFHQTFDHTHTQLHSAMQAVNPEMNF